MDCRENFKIFAFYVIIDRLASELEKLRLMISTIH